MNEDKGFLHINAEPFVSQQKVRADLPEDGFLFFRRPFLEPFFSFVSKAESLASEVLGTVHSVVPRLQALFQSDLFIDELPFLTQILFVADQVTQSHLVEVLKLAFAAVEGLLHRLLADDLLFTVLFLLGLQVVESYREEWLRDMDAIEDL